MCCAVVHGECWKQPHQECLIQHLLDAFQVTISLAVSIWLRKIKQPPSPLADGISRRLISFQHELSMLSLSQASAKWIAKLMWHNVVLIERICEWEPVFTVEKATHFVCSRRSLQTVLYFCTSTQTDCFAWRPLNANSESMSVFFVRSREADMSSAMYSVGVSAYKLKSSQSQLWRCSPG